MKKSIKYLLLIALPVLLSACSANKQSPYIMPTLKYNEPVKIHVAKKAYLLWQHGKDLQGETMPFQGGGIEGMVVSAIDAENRKNNPAKYHLSYGKAQQAGFITNFRDVLTNNRVFKQVELITNKNEIKPDGVLIIIQFKTTRVSGFEHNYKITLTTDMTIKTRESTFTRTYLTESDEGTFFQGKSFEEQTVDVSEQMIKQLMNGIQQWAKSNKF